MRRDGVPGTVDVTDLVPGDVVELALGSVVPADVRIVKVTDLECDESVLTGESSPADKAAAPVSEGADLAERSSCAFMGTVVHGGDGEGVVVATGLRTEFGKIAAGLGERQEETEFQAGLRRFSVLLVEVAGVLTSSIFVINLLLQRPLLESLLFSLAIAVGITPQLLPAVVTTSLATGSRHLARQGVLVKRLVCIEDLGDIEILLTDKTGTLTEGRISFVRTVGATGEPDPEVFRLGLMCNDAVVEHETVVGGNPLDVALWDAAGTQGVRLDGVHRVATAPFDHERRMSSVLVDDPTRGRLLVTKGAPESVLAVSAELDEVARRALDDEFAAGAWSSRWPPVRRPTSKP